MTAIRRLSSTTRRSFNSSLLIIAVFSLLLGLTELRLFELTGPAGWLLVVLPVVFWVYVGAGLVAWWLRPANGMGQLILIAGILVFISSAANTDVLALNALAGIATSLPFAAIAHVLLAFPTGRLPDSQSRALVIALYSVSLLLGIPSWLLDPDGRFPPFAIADMPDVVITAGWLQTIIGNVLMALVAIVLIGRLRRAEPAHRRVLMWLYSYGIFAVLVLPLLSVILNRVLGWDTPGRGLIQFVVAAGVPVAFALGVLRGGFARTLALEELSSWLGGPGSGRDVVEEALARTLGDRSVRLWLWNEERAAFVHAGVVSGTPEDGLGDRRAWERIDLDGRNIGGIDYDSALVVDPVLVRNAGRVVAIAVERTRLTAELVASQQAVMESRERLVEAADQERRRIARDLHDGLQSQLVMLALDAQQIATAPPLLVKDRATRLRVSIDAAAAELRSLVHELVPPALIERGLPAAASELADHIPIPVRVDSRLSRRLSEAIESAAYFVLAEALTNAVKHADARRIVVELLDDGTFFRLRICDDGRGGAVLGDGMGLQSMRDRAHAVGGTLRVESPLEGGTIITMAAPCGS